MRNATLVKWLVVCAGYLCGIATADVQAHPVSSRAYTEVQASISSIVHSGRVETNLDSGYLRPAARLRWYQMLEQPGAEVGRGPLSGEFGAGVMARFKHWSLALLAAKSLNESSSGDSQTSIEPLIEGIAGIYRGWQLSRLPTLFCEVYGEGLAFVGTLPRQSAATFVRCGPTWQMAFGLRGELHIKQREALGATDDFAERSSKTAAGVRVSRSFAVAAMFAQIEWVRAWSRVADHVYDTATVTRTNGAEGLFWRRGAPMSPWSLVLTAEWLMVPWADVFAVMSISYLVLGADDVVIDVIYWTNRQRLATAGLAPVSPSATPALDTCATPIAVITAAWKESDVIFHMLTANRHRILYRHYSVFVGCYPNDSATIEAVRRAQAAVGGIEIIINDRDGPTTKGQMLNVIVENIMQRVTSGDLRIRGILLHDAEDVIDPSSIGLIAAQSHYDFLQIPVFSLPLLARELVAGTYADEFAEWHQKDLLVRSHLGAAVPSAGVGTYVSMSAMQAVTELNGGRLLNEWSLTEDYELGHTVHRLGLKTAFILAPDPLGHTGRWIATQEYFPKKFRRSVRQKARWTTGIVLQASRSIGWYGGFWNRFFLWRDRKALIANFTSLVGLVVVCVFAALAMLEAEGIGRYGVSRASDEMNKLIPLFLASSGLMINRVTQRLIFTSRLYGLNFSLLSPLRAIIASFINAAAAIRAVRTYAWQRLTSKAPSWTKTEHELPQFIVDLATKYKKSEMHGAINET